MAIINRREYVELFELVYPIRLRNCDREVGSSAVARHRRVR